MKRKTPAKVVNLISRHLDTMDYIDECIRVKTTVPVENQGWHIQRTSVERMIGMADGANQMIEVTLFEHGCYAGYKNIGEKKTINGCSFREWAKLDDPNFADWRREYLTRGQS